MKLIIVVACALVAAAVAAPAAEEKVTASIVRSEITQNPDGNYNLVVETSDGVNREETGELKEVPNEKNELQKVVTVRGSYSYTDPEGNLQTFTYYGDETGFHVEGPSVPKVARR